MLDKGFGDKSAALVTGFQQDQFWRIISRIDKMDKIFIIRYNDITVLQGEVPNVKVFGGFL
jgi:hypothetical protein